MTSPTLESTTVTTISSSVTNAQFNLPGTYDTDDLLIAACVFREDGVTPDDGGGGTLEDWTQVDANVMSAFLSWQLWLKRADGAEDPTIDFTLDGSNPCGAVIARVSGAYDTGGEGTAFDITVNTTVNIIDDPNPPSVTATWGSDDQLYVEFCFAGNDSATHSPSTGYGSLAQVGTAALATASMAFLAETSASDDPDAMSLDTPEATNVATMVIRPAAGITVTPERAEVVVVANSPTAVVALQPERAEVALVARTPTVVANVGPAPLPFAEGGSTNPKIEVALNHESASSPADYVWTDWSDRLQSRIGDLQLDLNRGRSDEAAETEPSELGPIVLDNGDGALTPEFASSPYYPAIDVGLPLRYWEDTLTPGLVLPGLAGAVAFSEDHADFDITGDIDVRIRLEPETWSLGASYLNGSLASPGVQIPVSKWDAGSSQRSWFLALLGPGWLHAEASPDGLSATAGDASPTLVAALPGRAIWIGWTLDVDDGAGNHLHSWWRYDGDDPPDDITEWTLIAVDSDPGTTSIHSGTARLELGARSLGTGSPFAGRIEAFQLRDDINGSLVADADFTALEPGTLSFVDDAGKTWQLGGAAQISRRRLRFSGEVTEIDPFWPYGDNQPLAGLDDDRPTEARAAITAAGVLRRLGTGQDPLRSSLARHVVARPANVTAYWPCEEGRQAAQFGPGLPDQDALVTTGLDMAADTTLPASDALPTVSTGDTATWSGAVPTGPSDAWAVEMLLRIETPETSPTLTEILSITTAGTIARWTVEINDTSLVVTTYDSVGAVIDTLSTAIGSNLFGPWLIFRLEATQNGPDVDWEWIAVNIDIGSASSAPDTISGETLGAVTGIDTTTVGPPDGLSFGHIIVHDATLFVGWLAGADTAWVGETAAHRFFRLCAEEGIPASVVGDPAAATGTRGSLLGSQAMGPQGRKILVELLSECVAVDLGVLIENPGTPGLIYRCRSTLEDQEPRLVLDATLNEVIDVRPRRDNQGLVNELTVSSTAGASAIAVDEASRAKRSRYSDSVEINGVGGLDVQTAILLAQAGLAVAVDTQNINQATWRLQLANAEGMRYPTISIDLGTAPHLIEAWLATALGDRITLVGLPVQHPSDTVELLLQHAGETVTPSSWIVELAVTPGEPWLLGELA